MGARAGGNVLKCAQVPGYGHGSGDFYLSFDPLAFLAKWGRHATIGEVWRKPTQVTECGRVQSVADH